MVWVFLTIKFWLRVWLWVCSRGRVCICDGFGLGKAFVYV
jgi:hypothetical protein